MQEYCSGYVVTWELWPCVVQTKAANGQRYNLFVIAIFSFIVDALSRAVTSILSIGSCRLQFVL